MTAEELKIKKSDGLNESEKRLVKLGKKVFLELWSYPNTYYKPGKELADLLVVCDNHILIFSDKNIKFDMDSNVSVAWQRWHNKAILKSIKQLRKAEHNIRLFPDKVFLDPQCQQKLQVPLPLPTDMKIHLICVANGAKEACKRQFGTGCSGSLIFASNQQMETMAEADSTCCPKEGAEGVENKLVNNAFFTTDYDKTKTFVHVFDDFSLPFVLDELDTLKDFVNYLEEKETFIRKVKGIIYTGEEDLLYHYIKNYDVKRRRHVFIDKPDKKIKEAILFFSEENWNELRSHPQYIMKKNAEKISYIWDELIQKTGIGILSGKTKTERPKGTVHEGALRYMALENRSSRRFLCERMKQAYESYPINSVSEDEETPYVSLYYDYDNSEQVYFFLQLKQLPTDTYDLYRLKRKGFLELYGLCLKAKFMEENPQYPLKRIIAIGIEPVKYSKITSEDIILIDFSPWTDKEQQKYSNLRHELNLWKTPLDKAKRVQNKEYPDMFPKKIGRNAPCPCQSGKKYKKCCALKYDKMQNITSFIC